MRVWYRTKAWIEQFFSTAVESEVPTAHHSLATKLPQEIVDMVIGHLFYDTRSLLACSLTCYSWYIASVPLLHYTLLTRPCTPLFMFAPKREWPKPLRNASRFGLLPFVKKLHIRNVLRFSGDFSRRRLHKPSYLMPIFRAEQRPRTLHRRHEHPEFHASFLVSSY